MQMFRGFSSFCLREVLLCGYIGFYQWLILRLLQNMAVLYELGEKTEYRW